MTEANGFLTEEDRRFLRGEKEYTGEYASQNRYQRRKAIAERARKAFGDFALLHETLDRAERNRIFDVGPTEDPPVMRAIDKERGAPSREGIQEYVEQTEERAELREHVKDTLAFLYHSIEGEPGEVHPADQVFPVGFTGVLEGAVYDAERGRRESGVPVAGIDVTFEVDVYDPKIDYQYAAEKFARGEQNELSDRELRALLTALTSKSDFPADDFAQFGDLHDFADRVEERRDELEPDSVDVSAGGGDDVDQSDGAE
jgi:hypothetical protein